MRRRLYFILPSVDTAEALFDQLLLKRIPISHMHFIADEKVDLKDLPVASTLQQKDILHSMLIGVGIGAIIGIVGGFIAHGVMNIAIGGGMLAAVLIGAILGGWSASMIGLMVPNNRHKDFLADIEKGDILFLVDVPKERLHEIEEFVGKSFPQANYRGIEPTIPTFP